MPTKGKSDPSAASGSGPSRDKRDAGLARPGTPERKDSAAGSKGSQQNAKLNNGRGNAVTSADDKSPQDRDWKEKERFSGARGRGRQSQGGRGEGRGNAQGDEPDRSRDEARNADPDPTEED